MFTQPTDEADRGGAPEETIDVAAADAELDELEDELANEL